MVIDKRDILATSVRNVEELKRRYDLDKENEKAEPVDLSEYVKNDVFPISIANGGTGANNRASAVKNLYAYDLIGQTVIPADADLNTIDYCACGTYYQGANATVKTFTNCPTTEAFRMTVKSIDNKTAVSTVAWNMMRVREIETYLGNRYVQHLFVGDTTGTIVYGAWQQILTDRIGILKPTLLWTNATSGAMATQTVTIGDDVDNYSFVFVVYGPYNRGTQMTTGLHPVIKNTEFEVRLYASGLSYFGYRNLKFKDTTMTVGVGQEASSYTGSFSTFNSMAVPYYVYGVK